MVDCLSLCFSHAPKSLQHPAAMKASDILLLLLYCKDATLLGVCVSYDLYYYVVQFIKLYILYY